VGILRRSIPEAGGKPQELRLGGDRPDDIQRGIHREGLLPCCHYCLAEMHATKECQFAPSSCHLGTACRRAREKHRAVPAVKSARGQSLRRAAARSCCARRRRSYIKSTAARVLCLSSLAPPQEESEGADLAAVRAEESDQTKPSVCADHRNPYGELSPLASRDGRKKRLRVLG
jgi:hypothetical protein